MTKHFMLVVQLNTILGRVAVWRYAKSDNTRLFTSHLDGVKHVATVVYQAKKMAKSFVGHGLIDSNDGLPMPQVVQAVRQSCE